MTPALRAGRLVRVAVVGVAGLSELDVELRPITALVGPRGSGKSQLLASIAWLVTGRPSIVTAAGAASTIVSGELRVDGRAVRVARTREGGLSRAPAGSAPVVLPTCSFLRARSRLGEPWGSSGTVAGRMSEAAGVATSDAVAAEALVSVMGACCEDCVTGEILLVEEPELELTPQAQRYLYGLLRRFAESGNQVVYSTRSPAFVDAAHHDEIIRLDLRRGRPTPRRTSPDTLKDPERVRLAAQFDHERSEMFFAEAVVLVEGQTERLSLPFIFRALGHDPDAAGIAIVEVGGKSNLSIAARMLTQLQIPFVVVFDGDRGAASAALDAEIRRSAGRAPVIRLEPDFEAVAGIASHEDKVLHAWRRFASARAAAVPQTLGSIVNVAVGLAAEASGSLSQPVLARVSGPAQPGHGRSWM